MTVEQCSSNAFQEKNIMLYTEGMLCAEDRALRRIARTKVNESLRAVETKTTVLLDALIVKLTAQTEATCTIDHLLKLIFAHPNTQADTSTIERYTRAFPELETMVAAARERLNTRARTRLEGAFAPFQYARRFRFAKGVPSH